MFVCFLLFAVGGVTSPWRGEYREPRHLSLNKENTPQTSLFPTVSSVSETGSDPKLAVKVSCASPVLRPPSLEQTEEVEGTPWNVCKELREAWDPPPLASTPLPLKSCSHMERATTISEQELQQLEIGKQWAMEGIQLFEHDQNTGAFYWPLDSYFWGLSLDVIFGHSSSLITQVAQPSFELTS